MNVTIRAAKTHHELHACIDLQIAVWAFSEREVVPFHQLHAAHEWGGQVQVAMEGDRVVGFCYGFGGRQYGRPALCSHMLAVLPEYRGQEVGARLKLAQASWAREVGYDLITWTYDPLEAVNANLNIARLGGIARQYLVNHYGEMADGLNKGLPSDRLLLEWHLNRPAVAKPAADEVRVPIPRGFQKMKAADPAGALWWRLRVREQLTGALDQGYTLTGFHMEADSGAYILTKE